LDIDFDDIEAPREVAGAEPFEPVVGPALDEALLGLVHRMQGADLGVFLAGFDFDEQEHTAFAGDDIDLAGVAATVVVAVIFGQHFAAVGNEPGGGHPFAVAAEPESVTRGAIRRRQVAGRVERRAQTSDDGGDKGREAEAFQDGV